MAVPICGWSYIGQLTQQVVMRAIRRVSLTTQRTLRMGCSTLLYFFHSISAWWNHVQSSPFFLSKRERRRGTISISQKSHSPLLSLWFYQLSLSVNVPGRSGGRISLGKIAAKWEFPISPVRTFWETLVQRDKHCHKPWPMAHIMQLSIHLRPTHQSKNLPQSSSPAAVRVSDDHVAQAWGLENTRSCYGPVTNLTRVAGSVKLA